MADTMTFTPAQLRWMLEYWDRELQKWIDWLNTQALTGESLNRETERILTILRQQISLTCPWMSCLISSLPVTIPEGMTVKKLDYRQPDYTSWSQQLTDLRATLTNK